ncbi:MAG: hypothetical protein POELPBGB_00715 [Bacteroidia bacterium]|nr:hypothetical protein [Bacteroidia bacterium]
MLKRIYFCFAVLILSSCKGKVETIKPEVSSITESVYASGIIKSKNQYQVFPSVSGIVDSVWVTEGDTVKQGSVILVISGKAQKLNKELAALSAAYSDADANRAKLDDANMLAELAKSKMLNDSLLYFRQKNLWEKQIGSKLEFEQRQLAYANSKTAYNSAVIKYNDLKRQIDFSSLQSKKNLQLSDAIENDFSVESSTNGIVYSVLKSKGEIATPQTPVAIIGDASDFILEMQVDEYDILKIKKGQNALITMDSYKDRVYEAVITKINPLMNERSKTFLVEAVFIQRPEILYPNITFEASIVIKVKQDALLIPRNYLLNDTSVINKNDEIIVIKTGLKDYRKIEVLSGITADDELVKPAE